MSGSTDRPHRIIYVLERFPADTLNFVYNEIKVLETEGLQVEIYSLQPGIVCPDEARELAARTRTVRPIGPRPFLAAWLHYGLRRPFALLDLCIRLPFANRTGRWRKAVRTIGHIVVGVQFAWMVRNMQAPIHAHFAFKAATAAMVAARLNRTTFSFTAHGSATVVAEKTFNLAEKVRAARFVIPVSEFNRSVLQAACPEVAPERLVVNRTGILLDQFPLRAAEPAAAPPLRIFCVASLYPVKNHDGLLRSCGLLARRGVEFRLDLVGSDPVGLAEGLRDLAQREGIAERVVFHGSVDHGRIADLLADAHVCILTSLSEGIPVSLMEAMARGVAVVGPRVTGVPELIRDGETGLLGDPNQPAEFTDALEKLAHNPDLRAELAAAARTLVEAQYDMRANAQRLANVFLARMGVEEDTGHGPGVG